MTENRFLLQALLHQERLKERRVELKRLAKENAKAAKAACAQEQTLEGRMFDFWSLGNSQNVGPGGSQLVPGQPGAAPPHARRQKIRTQGMT